MKIDKYTLYFAVSIIVTVLFIIFQGIIIFLRKKEKCLNKNITIDNADLYEVYLAKKNKIRSLINLFDNLISLILLILVLTMFYVFFL